MSSRKKTYTIIQAAKILGVSRAAVHKAIRAGRLKAIPRKVTRFLWQIDATSLRAYKGSASRRKYRGEARAPRVPRKKG